MTLTYLIPNRSRKGGGTPIVDVAAEGVGSSWGQADNSLGEPQPLQGSDGSGGCRAWLRSGRDAERGANCFPKPCKL